MSHDTNLSRDEVEALMNTKDGYKGCGIPQPITQRLARDGYIELSYEGNDSIWQPRLTQKGKRALQ